MPDPNCGDLHMPIIPTNMEKHRIVAQSPGLQGSQNEEVYKGLLGLSDEEYDALAAKHVIAI